LTPNADDAAPLNTTNHQPTLSSMSLSIPIPLSITIRALSGLGSTPLSSQTDRTGAWAKSSQACSSLFTSPATHHHKLFAIIDTSPTLFAYHTPTTLVASSRLRRGSRTIHVFARYISPSPSQHQSGTTGGSNSMRTKSALPATSCPLPSPFHPSLRHRTGPGTPPAC